MVSENVRFDLAVSSAGIWACPASGSKQYMFNAQARCPLFAIKIDLARAGRTFAAFIDLQSCPRGLAVPEKAVAVPLSEPG